MNKEFIFGKTVSGDNFIARENEIYRLGLNFKGGINTILSSPRRWGKTSLVNKVREDVGSDKLRIVYIDIFSCKDEYEFYNIFAEGVLKACSSKFEEWVQLATSFLSRLTPKVSFGTDPYHEYSVSLGISPKTHTPDEVLNLPEVIAQRKGIQIVVCIDEFQQIGDFSDATTVLKRMRTAWQHHTRTTYCLFGSRKHLMDELFQRKNQAFYKFGSHFQLELIDTEAWVNYICRQFKNSGKHISPELAEEICRSVENHSSYVQQLAWITFVDTKDVVTKEHVERAKETLLDENSALYTQQTEHLSAYQINFLRAILDGIHSGFGVADVRETYRLGSSSNIAILKKAMINKEIIEQRKDGFYFTDPVLKIWLKRTLLMR